MNKYLCLCFLIFTSFSSQSQNKKNYLESLSYDELKEAFFKNEGKIEIQKKYAKAFLNKAKKENNTPKIARGYYYHSFLYDDNRKIVYFDSIINNVKYPPSEKNFPFVAHLEKGYFLADKYRYNEAINCYLELEKLAISKNLNYYYKAKFAIGVLKSEKMGEVKESLPLFKECYTFYKSQKNNPDLTFTYQLSIFALADSYKSLKEIDSATYYNKLGYFETKKSKNDYLHNIFILNEGANQVLANNFKATLDSVTKALPYIIKNKDNNNILASYYYRAKAYQGLGVKIKALENYKKVDSLYKLNSFISPEFSDGYKFIIDYYKESGDKENQLKYLTTYLEIQNHFQKEYKELSVKLKNDYDLPNLVKDKELLINALKTEEKKYFWLIIFLIGLALCFVIISIYQSRQKKKYKINFEKLINQTSKPEIHNDVIITQTPKKESLLSISLVKDLNDKLKRFEKDKIYKNSNINIQNLAIEFKTNTKYLSLFINENKNKSFVNYINDLRIDNIIEELKQNKNLRKYTIAALAEEAGFNTAESFSNAFYKRTEIKPSFFIKELKEI
ncbi:helix-turn-helix domain-containing protein [Flavobacterium facile]|uniref:helix-turn-helix domain-containing protein n=1 Tax=Flavobacterium facile TaxID=2893174 RepID=UPI002E77F6CC|nr:helix-turn-helix domain-containing protein [Flavobacterium sp. T-12]